MNKQLYPEVSQLQGIEATFATQMVDAMSDGLITYRQMLFDETYSDRTLDQQRALEEFYLTRQRSDYDSRYADKMNFVDRFAAGWANAADQQRVDGYKLKILEARKNNDILAERDLRKQIASLEYKMANRQLPATTDAWSAFNLGAGIQSNKDAFLTELGSWAATTFVLNGITYAATALTGGAAGPAAAASTVASAAKTAKLLNTLNKIKKGVSITSKVGTQALLWDMFRRREAGSMYSALMDSADYTEQQKRDMVNMYSTLSASVELFSWNLGAGKLLAKGTEAAFKAFGRSMPVMERWLGKQALYEAVEKTAKETSGITLKKVAQEAAKVGIAVAAESAEEAEQQSQQQEVIERAKAGEGVNVFNPADLAQTLGGSFYRLGKVPVEMLQGKLSNDSLEILQAFNSAILPSLVMAGFGGGLSMISRNASATAPVNTGNQSSYAANTASFNNAVHSAERNMQRIEGVLNLAKAYGAQNEESAQQIVNKLVKSGQLEEKVYMPTEDAEILLALGEEKPSINNILQRTGLRKAIQNGAKTGTVEFDMSTLVSLGADASFIDSPTAQRVAKSAMLSSDSTSYSVIDRQIKSQKKATAEKVMKEASPKLQQKIKGIRRQFEVAKYEPEEIDAAVATTLSAFQALADASSGRVTIDKLIDDFTFDIERRDYSLRPKDEAKTIAKILGDRREMLGLFRQFRPKEKLTKAQARKAAIQSYSKPLAEGIATGKVVSPMADIFTIMYGNDQQAIENTIKKLIDGDVKTYNEVDAYVVHKGKEPTILDDFIANMRQAVDIISVSGGLDAGDAYRSATVYAASRRDYLYPKLAAIGEGEGNQAHGWGLYYALYYRIAEAYRYNQFESINFFNKRYKNRSICAILGDLPSITANTYGLTNKDKDIVALRNLLTQLSYISPINLPSYENIKKIKERMSSLATELSNDQDTLVRKKKDPISSIRTIEEIQEKIDENKNYIKKYKQQLKDLSEKASSSIKDELIDSLRRSQEDYLDYAKDAEAAARRTYNNTAKWLRKLQKRHAEMLKQKKEITDEKALLVANLDIEELERGIANVKNTLSKDRELLYRAKIDVDIKTRSVALANNKELPNNITFELNVNLGQVKKFTIRKLDTFIEEDTPLFAHNSYVQKTVRKMLSEDNALTKRLNERWSIGENYLTVDEMIDYMQNWDGEKLYDELTDIFDSKKRASLFLREHGIYGLTYHGGRDKRCFVAFTPQIVTPKGAYFDFADGYEDAFLSELFDDKVGLEGKKFLYVAKHADMTTYEHELMHFVTNSLVEMYNNGYISEYWGKQLDALYDYFKDIKSPETGHRAMTKVNGKLRMDKEAKETLSTGFQKYLETGKAKTPVLERLYAFIKSLSADMKKATQRGYFRDRKLSDVQIDFYNRIVETQLDIENTEYQYGYAPLEQLPGVSDEEYEEYQTERKVARSRSANSLFQAQRDMVKARAKARWKQLYSDAFDEAKGALEEEAEYRVIRFVSENGLLNRDALMSAAKEATDVPDKYFADEGGLAPEELIKEFGPELTIADIVDMLIKTPDINQAAAEAAKQVADTKYMEETDPMTDAAPANALRIMLFVRSLLKESFMIKSRPLSEFGAYYGDWLDSMEEYIGKMTLRNATDLRKWADEESRITDDFVAAFNGGDTATASLKAEQRAAVNYLLVRNKQLLKERARFETVFGKFRRNSNTSDVKKLDGTTWNLIHQILREFGFTTRPGRINASAYNQLEAWLEARAGNSYIPFQYFENTKSLLMHPPRMTSLTVNQFEQLTDLLTMLKQIGEAETKVFQGERQERLDVVVGQMIENVDKLRQNNQLKKYRTNSLTALSTPQLGLLEPLFGKIGMRELYMQLREALVARDNLEAEVRDQVADTYVRNNIGALLKDTREFKIGDRTVTNEILLFALQHSGNTHNKENAIVTLQQYYKDESFSEDEYEDFLNATTPEMRNYINDLWAIFANIKKLIDAQTKAATGGLIGTVTAEPYTMRDGTKMSGGYFPAAKVNFTEEVEDMNAYMNPDLFFPNMGIAKDRIKNKMGDLDMSQKALSRWMYQAVTLATMQVAFNDIMVVTQSKELLAALGEDGKDVMNYIRDFARLSVKPILPRPRFITSLQRLPMAVYMGFRAVSGLVQTLGILPALTEVNSLTLLKHSTNILNLPKYFRIKAEMSKRSAVMADRARNFDSKYFGLMNDKTWFEKTRRKFGDGYMMACMSFVRTFQGMTDLIVWDAAHEQSLREGNDEVTATRDADYAVLKTQGDRTEINTPRGFGDLLKFFQPFMSYILTLKQMSTSAGMLRNYKKLGAIIAMVVLSNLIEAYLKESDKDWRRKLLNKRVKGTDADFKKRVTNRFVAQTINTLGGMALPFADIGPTILGTVTEPYIKQLLPGYRTYTAGGIAPVEVLERAGKMAIGNKNAWKDVYDEDMDLWSNLIDFLL